MRSFIAMAVATALAMGAGCGGGDDEAADPGAPPAVTQDELAAGSEGEQSLGNVDRPGPVLTGNVEQARAGAETVDDVYEDFAAAVRAGVSATDVPARETLDTASSDESLASVCDLMSEEAKRQTIEYARRSAGLADVKWTCENASGLLLRRARQAGGLGRVLRTEIVGVNVEGDRATASVRFGGKDPVSSISLVKEDGGWKLAATPSGGESK